MSWFFFPERFLILHSDGILSDGISIPRPWCGHANAVFLLNSYAILAYRSQDYGSSIIIYMF